MGTERMETNGQANTPVIIPNSIPKTLFPENLPMVYPKTNPGTPPVSARM